MARKQGNMQKQGRFTISFFVISFISSLYFGKLGGGGLLAKIFTIISSSTKQYNSVT